MANNKISLFFKSLLLGIFISGFGVNGHAANLPAGYTELEYISTESAIGPYIDTGLTAGSNTRVLAQYKLNSVGFTSPISVRDENAAGAGFGVGINGSQQFISDYNGDRKVFTTITPNATDIITVDKNKNVCTITIGGQSETVTNTVSTFTTTNTLPFFAQNSVGTVSVGRYTFYSFKMWNNDTLVRDLIPAKNSSNVIGMYDLVSGQFFTNAGTGEFIAGPVVPENIYSQKFAGYIDGYFKSVDNNRVIMSYAGNSILILNTEIGKTYTLKNTKTLMNASAGPRIFSSNVMPVVGTIYTPDQFYTVTDATTWVEGVTFTAKDIYTALLVRGDADNSANHDLAYIAEGLELYEIYQAPIKIATTAYNSARFSPVVTELNDTIATIRSVVTNTINQTKAIADLQATKQTRPDETCPAGKKCLLVEDDAGQPHWYEIIESASRLPDGYIERQYIYMMDGSYLTTDIVPSSDMRIEMDFATTSINPLSNAYFGCRTMAAGVEGISLLHKASTNGGYIIADGFVDEGRYTSNYVPVANTRYKYVYNAGEMSLSTGGTVVASHTFTPDSTVTTPIAINAFNDNGAISTNREGIYLYSFKAWNGQGELVADYVPAVQEGTVPVVGFYDTVSGTFKTATAGTFTAGPEVQ